MGANAVVILSGDHRSVDRVRRFVVAKVYDKVRLLTILIHY